MGETELLKKVKNEWDEGDRWFSFQVEVPQKLYIQQERTGCWENKQVVEGEVEVENQ